MFLQSGSEKFFWKEISTKLNPLSPSLEREGGKEGRCVILKFHPRREGRVIKINYVTLPGFIFCLVKGLVIKILPPRG